MVINVCRGVLVTEDVVIDILLTSEKRRLYFS